MWERRRPHASGRKNQGRPPRIREDRPWPVVTRYRAAGSSGRHRPLWRSKMNTMWPKLGADVARVAICGGGWRISPRTPSPHTIRHPGPVPGSTPRLEEGLEAQASPLRPGGPRSESGVTEKARRRHGHPGPGDPGPGSRAHEEPPMRGGTGGSSHTTVRQRGSDSPPAAAYLILASLNSTCLRTTGSYLLKLSFSVFVRGFFFVT